MKIPSIEEMLKAGMHFGHHTSKWHPKMEPYIFTHRNKVHVIDLVKSRKMMESSMEYIKKMVAEDKTILFVGTKAQTKEPIKKLADEYSMPYVVEKWIGGTLTNYPVIKKMIKKYVDYMNDKKSGALKKYTKKERLEIDREIAKLELKVGGLVNMRKLPDIIFVWDVKKEKTAIMESKKKNIPIMAVCDTNVDPTGIKYIIPSNDDATKSIKLVLGVVNETMKEAKASTPKSK